MNRLEEDEKKKLYEAINCFNKRDGRKTTSLEVIAQRINDGVEEEIAFYRMITEFDNYIGFCDFVFNPDYITDENKEVPIVLEYTLDIPKEIYTLALAIHTNDEIVSMPSLIEAFIDDGIQGAENLRRWFLKRTPLNEMLSRYDHIGQPKVEKVAVDKNDEKDNEIGGFNNED